jgi:hypothetical protein
MSPRDAASRRSLYECIWLVIGRVLASTSARGWLIRQAKKRPFQHLKGYMHRWELVPQSWGLPISIRVHHILRADADPYLHDHPWNWRSVILCGWYEEEDVFGQCWIHLQGETRAASAETFHRINRVSKGGVWTLFIMGRWRNRWGFMVGEPPRKVYYRDYVSKHGRGELTDNEDAP